MQLMQFFMKLSRVLLFLVPTIPTMLASGAVRYVDLNSTNATLPFTNWATAAVVIQDAVDVAEVGDTVLVNNGVYQTGNRVAGMAVTNRVAITKAVTVQSVNGPAVTTIRGNLVPYYMMLVQMRCVYLASGAMLSGVTLTTGLAYSATIGGGFSRDGGGVYCASASAVVSNCVITFNGVDGFGGGVYGGTLYDCILARNNAPGGGGGAADSTLNRCKVIDNSAYDQGGGAYYCTLNSCAVVGNRLDGNSGSGGGAVSCL